MPTTLTDIAKQLGLATSTVADVLKGRPGYSEKTVQRVMKVARELDFVPNYHAKSLLKQRSHTIGIAGRLESATVSGPMLKAISDGLLAKDYLPLFCESAGDEPGEARAITELRGRMVDGMILNIISDEAVLKELLPKRLPCVMIRNQNLTDRPCVVSDRMKAYAHGVRWLADRGHTRIAFMGTGNKEVMDRVHNSHRLKIVGYTAGMKELGLFDESLLLDGDNTPGSTRKFVHEHAELFKSITAVLAGNDRIAIEVISALSKIGLRVPDDCSVIGFDNSEFSVAVHPRLTTFHPMLHQVGAKAAEMMLDLIDGKDAPSVTIIPELIERESTRAI